MHHRPSAEEIKHEFMIN